MPVNLVFTDEHASLTLYVNAQKKLYIGIESDMIETIALTKQDAIKLSKELKKQKNILNEIDSLLKTKQCSVLITHQDSGFVKFKEKEKTERLIRLILKEHEVLFNQYEKSTHIDR